MMRKGFRLSALVLAVLFVLLCSGCIAVPAAPSGSGSLARAAQAEFNASGGISGGGQKYCDYFGRPMEDWCADFVCYCADQAGLLGKGKPFGPHTAGCAALWRQLQAGGATMFTLFDAEPQAGDVVFWYATAEGPAATLDRVDDLSHVGIVTGFSGGILTTVEGNCGSSDFRTSKVAQNQYSSSALHGQCWQGAAIFGFARVQGDSANLTELIKGFEGFSRFPVWDYAQWSVGYGTRCPDDMLEVYRQAGITEAEATALLEQHLQTSIGAVSTYIRENGLVLESYQQDALVSLTYNLGPGWMEDGSYTALKAALQSGGEQQIMAAFADICHAGGEVLPALIERRLCEGYLYLTGQYVTDYTQTGYSYVISGGEVVVFRKAP